MNSNHYDIGRRGGETVVVTLSGSAANVRLMDSSNFQSYRSGRSHRYIGGLAKSSPVRSGIPHSGNWHVTVDILIPDPSPTGRKKHRTPLHLWERG